MKQKLKLEQLKSLLPYFMFAVAVIVAYKVITDLDIFVNFLNHVWNIVTPFFYGFLLAYIINIPYSSIYRVLGKLRNSFVSRRKKMFGIFISYLLFFLLFFIILILVIPSLYNSIRHFASDFWIYYRRIEEFIKYINDLDFLDIEIKMDNIMSMFQKFSIENLGASFSALFSVSSAIFKGFLTVVSSVYILSEKEAFKAFLRRLIRVFSPDAAYNAIMKYSLRLNNNCKQYIYTQTIDGFILGAIATIELYFLRSQYALMLGVMLGVVNYIPYFGSIAGSVVAVVIVALTQGASPAVIAAVVLLVTQQIDGNVIQPKLMGGSFSLSPLLVIVSITIGGAFSGVLGMMLAIPIVAVLKDLLEDIVKYYERQKWSPSKNWGPQ